MGKVSVHKGLLMGVVAVAAASLLGVTFLLGRASVSGGPSGHPTESARTSGVAASGETDPRVPGTGQPQPAPSGDPITAGAGVPAPGGDGPSRQDDGTAPEAARTAAGRASSGDGDVAGSGTEQTAVAAYLDALDHIQPVKMSGDAQTVANEMASALVKGDTSGLERMIRETEAAKESLVALTPPASCTGLQRECLASLDDALEVLRSLKTAMESPDPGARLADVATRAAALQSRSEALRREEQALRRRYGLAR